MIEEKPLLNDKPGTSSMNTIESNSEEVVIIKETQEVIETDSNENDVQNI